VSHRGSTHQGGLVTLTLHAAGGGGRSCEGAALRKSRGKRKRRRLRRRLRSRKSHGLQGCTGCAA
jgi:hypothetical protein